MTEITSFLFIYSYFEVEAVEGVEAKNIAQATGKKRRFFKVFKLTWYKCITTVSKENVQKNK